MQDFHGQDGPGVLQVGDVEVARCVAGQADVQNPAKGKKRRSEYILTADWHLKENAGVFLPEPYFIHFGL